MGKTLWRYVLTELGALLALGLVLITFVLATVEVIDLVDLAFAKGVPALRVVSLFAYLVPSYLELTVPMALLLTIAAALARLSRDGELLALGAAGVSIGQVARPVFIVALGVAGLSFALAGWTSPWANRALERLTTDMARTRISAALTPGIFSPWVSGINVYVGSIERRSGELTEVIVADEREVGRLRTIFASSGRLTTDDVEGVARLTLRNGTMLAAFSTPGSFDETSFATFELNVRLASESVTTDSSFMDEPRRMDWRALLASRQRLREQGKAARDQQVEIQRRLALSFACVLLPLVGIPLGAGRGRSTRSRGVIVGIGIITGYYFLIAAGITLSHRNVVGPVLALWTPNLVLLTVGMVMFRHLLGKSHGRSLRPSRLGVARRSA